MLHTQSCSLPFLNEMWCTPVLLRRTHSLDDSDHDWTKRSDCERWMYMSLSCSAYVKDSYLVTNYKMIPPSCQKHSRTRHAACNCTSVHCDNGGPMEPMSSHKSENPREVPLHCVRCTADYVFPTRTTFRFLTEFSHLAVTLYSCWGTHHLDSCTRTVLCEQRSASPRATDEEEEDRDQEHQPHRKGFEHEVVILHCLLCHNRSITYSQNNLSIQHYHCHVPCGVLCAETPHHTDADSQRKHQ